MTLIRHPEEWASIFTGEWTEASTGEETGIRVHRNGRILRPIY